MLPKVDVAFKMLFGDGRNRNLLADFLKAVLPDRADEEFTELTIPGPRLKRKCIDDKLEILDVQLHTARGQSIDLDIQISALPEMGPRIAYYLCAMITEQPGRGARDGDPEQAISIVNTDYDFIPEATGCHTAYRLPEPEEHFPFNGPMEIHVLNLKRLPAEEKGRLPDWLRFLKAETAEEFKMLAEKNPMLEEAYCGLQVMSKDEASRMFYEARLKAQREEYSRIQGALRKGWEEGLAKGLEKGRRQILALAQQGYTVEQIEAKLQENCRDLRR
jgi:predicted transposase/invertase (TIGR01784 family)